MYIYYCRGKYTDTYMYIYYSRGNYTDTYMYIYTIVGEIGSLHQTKHLHTHDKKLKIILYYVCTIYCLYETSKTFCICDHFLMCHGVYRSCRSPDPRDRGSRVRCTPAGWSKGWRRPGPHTGDSSGELSQNVSTCS